MQLLWTCTSSHLACNFSLPFTRLTFVPGSICTVSNLSLFAIPTLLPMACLTLSIISPWAKLLGTIWFIAANITIPVRVTASIPRSFDTTSCLPLISRSTVWVSSDCNTWSHVIPRTKYFRAIFQVTRCGLFSISRMAFVICSIFTTSSFSLSSWSAWLVWANGNAGFQNPNSKFFWTVG